MPRHIRDLNVYPARNFKFSKDSRQLLDEVLAISGIVKVEVTVISEAGG